MIDLERALPSVLVVDGEEVPIDTSFRAWLRFGRALQEGFADRSVLLSDTDGGWQAAALEFYRSDNPLPRSQGSGRLMDFTIDSDYLVGAFQQAYGIDLTSCDMHWHRFLALVRSLPDDTRLSRIMGYRAYEDGKRKPEEVRRMLREDWALPRRNETEVIRWQQEVFGGIVPEVDGA